MFNVYFNFTFFTIVMSFLVIHMSIFLTVCCLFILFVFQFRQDHWFNPSSHGRKIRHDQLKVSGDDANWLWQQVNVSGLALSLKLGIPS